MSPISSNPILAHQRMILAFCDDLLAGDWDAPRTKAVVEISRRMKEGDLASPTVAGAPAGPSRDASRAKPLIDYRKEAGK